MIRNDDERELVTVSVRTGRSTNYALTSLLVPHCLHTSCIIHLISYTYIPISSLEEDINNQPVQSSGETKTNQVTEGVEYKRDWSCVLVGDETRDDGGQGGEVERCELNCE